MYVDPDLREEGQDPALFRMLVNIASKPAVISVIIVGSVSM